MRKVRLGDICDVLNGYAFKSSNYVLDGIRIIRITNVQKGYIADDDPKYYPIEAQDTLKKYMLNQDDLLISLTGNVGRVGLLPKLLLPAALNQRVACLRLKNSGVEIDRKYLFHALNSDIFENACIYSSNGIAQKNLSTEWLKDYYIPLYSVEKQKIIVEKLDLIIRLINLRTLQLQKLDELVKSRFIEMFGDPVLNPKKWNILKIEQLVTLEPQNGLYKPQSSYVENNDGIPILRIDAFYSGRVSDFACLKRLKCTQAELEKYQLQENDIVINRVNSLEYLGKCALIRGSHEHTVFESNMMRFHLDEKNVNPIFATFLLCTAYMKKQILSRAKKAVNQASINQKDVMNFHMIVPDIELQNKFADFVKSTDKLKIAIQKSLDELETLKKSLMQQYFG